MSRCAEGILQVGDDMLVRQLLGRHGEPATLLLSQATQGRAEGPWQRVVRRPASIGEIVAAASALLPLPPQVSRPLD